MPAVTKTFVLDALERIAYTFVGSFIGALSVAWASSGLDVEHFTDWSAWQKLLTSAVVAACAAAFTTVKTLIAGLITGTGSTSKQVAESAVVPTGDHAATVALMPELNDSVSSGTPPAVSDGPTADDDAAAVLARADSIHAAPSSASVPD